MTRVLVNVAGVAEHVAILVDESSGFGVLNLDSNRLERRSRVILDA